MPKSVKNFLNERLLAIAIFSLAFAVLGQAIPNLYYRYFDFTKYYDVSLPVQTDKAEYNACDDVSLYIQRTSLIDTPADSVMELVLIDGDDFNEVDRFNRVVGLNKGTERTVAHFKLSCDVKPGKYFFRGIISFDINGVEKHYPIFTSQFNVTNTNGGSNE